VDNHWTSSKSKLSDDVKYVDKVIPGNNRGVHTTSKSTTSHGIQFCENFLTSTEVARVQEIQHNLEVIANLVFCCVNGKIPENRLLEISSCEDAYLHQGVLSKEFEFVEQKRLLTVKDYADFKNSINNLFLDIRRLRGYIAKKYAGELTEQCYVQ